MDDKIKITYPGSEKVYMTGKLHPENQGGDAQGVVDPDRHHGRRETDSQGKRSDICI